MGTDNDPINDERIYKKSFFMPFGIYNTDKQASGRAAEVLVGRYNERASFIRRLLNSGKGGAYLITGQRGTGKTSFVDYCMDAYEQHSVQRFMNSELAKTWRDKFVFLFLVVTLLLFPGFLVTLLKYSDDNAIAFITLGIPLVALIIGLVYFSYLPIKNAFTFYLIKRADQNKRSKDVDKSRSNVASRLLDKVKRYVPVVIWSVLFAVISMLNFMLSFTLNLLIFVILGAILTSLESLVTSTHKKASNTRFKRRIIELSIFKTCVSLIYLCTLIILFFNPNPVELISIVTKIGEAFDVPSLNTTGFIVGLLSLFLIIASSVSLIIYCEDKVITKPAQLILQNKSLSTEDKNIVPQCFSNEVKLDFEHLKEKSAYQNAYRDLLKNSWLTIYIGIWKPVIKIKINLGFDDIEHENIVYGLLKQLRTTYAEHFLAFKNLRVLATRSFIFILFFAISIHMGDALFAFKDRDTIKDSQNQTTHQQGSQLVSNLFGFQLYKVTVPVADKPKTVDYYVKITHPNKNADCYPPFKDMLTDRIEKYRCTHEQSRAYMLNPDLFYWLYVDLITVELDVNEKPTDKTHSDFFPVVNLFLSKTIFPFEESHYQLPRTEYLKKNLSHETAVTNITMNKLNLATDPYNKSYSIRAYHLYLLLLITVLYFSIDVFMPILPYRSNNRKLGKIIDRLTSTQTSDSTMGVGSLKMAFPFSKNRTYKPLGSRDIEQHFLEIIYSLSEDGHSLMGHLISVPTPDITIIFDELDKMGTSIKEQEKIADNTPLSTETHTFEYVRSRKIKELLSDLKNVIDSKYCRFILIGGRHLHDEWLADQTKRDQLLPSIFDKAIYLPSLLTNATHYEPDLKEDLLLLRTKEYISQQYVRAKRIQKYVDENENKTILLTKIIKPKRKQRFADQSLVVNRMERFFSSESFSDDRPQALFYLHSPNDLSKASQVVSTLLLNQFVKYLAYRSHGIPKRLNEVFAAYLKPRNRVINSSGKALPETDINSDIQTEKERIIADGTDLLLFTDTDLYRIQLTARLYDRINNFLGLKLYARDDKLVTAVFYITDYLLKFHSRAFDWDSLEKIDDIADINRSPDLREIIHELIDSFSEMLLHPILNGMYTFRFKSAPSREITYLSKRSPTDSAAFNFTLDESQTLKELYARKLENPSSATPDISSALGELYEYDQEYDAARKEYHKTIVMIDNKLGRSLLHNPENGDKKDLMGYISILTELENAGGQDKKMMTSFIIDWVMFRLRLMLKIAMTFEHTRNYERAQAYYHETHILSRRFLRLIAKEKSGIDKDGIDIEDIGNKCSEPSETATIDVKNTYFMAKHFNMLYQAVFAKAWLAEKLGAGVDTSLTILKTELFYFEHLFPQFSLDQQISNYLSNLREGDFTHASFGLIKSEFYNKAGDLCFFKGANLPEKRYKESDSSPNEAFKHENELSKHGYLYKASYYYATSLHYLRHFNLYRHEASKIKYSSGEGNGTEPTFSAEQLPNYPLIESASTLADISEVLLARLDIKSLLRGLIDKSRKSSDLEPQDLVLNESYSIEKLFYNYMVTGGIYFDKWLKYNDFGEGVRNYHDMADQERKNKNKRDDVDHQVDFVFSLWNNKATQVSHIDKKRFIDMWVGTTKKVKPQTMNQDIIESSASSECSIERLLCYITLINISVSNLRDAGKLEEAAYELRRAVDSIIAILDLFLLIKTQASDNNDNHIGKEFSKTDLKSESLKAFITFLIEQGVYYIDRSAILYSKQSAEKAKHQQKPNITDVISSKLALSAIKLCVIATKSSILWDEKAFIFRLRYGYQGNTFGDPELKHHFSLEQIIYHLAGAKTNITIQPRVDKALKVLTKLFTFVPEEEQNEKAFHAQSVEWLFVFEKLLEDRCVMHRYPILDRLRMLQQMSLLISQSGKIRDGFISLELNEKIQACLLKNFNSSVKNPETDVIRDKLTAYIILILESSLPYHDNKNILQMWRDEPNKEGEEQSEKELCFDSDYVIKALDLKKKLTTYISEHKLQPGNAQFIEQTIVDLKSILINAMKYPYYMAINHTKELLEIEEQYDSPHHFTPTQVAYTCFQLADSLKKNADDINKRLKELNKTDTQNNSYILLEKLVTEREKDAKYFYICADEYFSKSQQMYTLRGKYYKSIDNMYYLYDDFNDRYVHNGKAIQIMSSSVSFEVEHEIHKRLKILDQKDVWKPE